MVLDSCTRRTISASYGTYGFGRARVRLWPRIVRILHQRMRLFGDVDADRAPRDAAAAPDAAGAPVLVMPGAELVHQPLAIAKVRRPAHHPAVDVAVARGEA